MTTKLSRCTVAPKSQFAILHSVQLGDGNSWGSGKHEGTHTVALIKHTPKHSR